MDGWTRWVCPIVHHLVCLLVQGRFLIHKD
jgi:hypothetical protein